MLSVQLAEHIAPLPEDQHATDLFLHLLASHHGHGRPFAPVCLDEAPPAVEGKRAETVITLDAAERAAIPPPHRIDSGIPDRFWRLVRRHGWWGLAYLEAILRLSDWYASEYVKAEDESQQTEAVA
jgi:CRISPR-associated endonuclease/helicase Cas3